MNNPFKKSLSMLLTVTLLFTQTGVAVFADDILSPPFITGGLIMAFESLTGSVAEQTVPAGTQQYELKLPDTLDALIEYTDADSRTVLQANMQAPVMDWESEPDYEPDTAGVYVFSPVLDSVWVLGFGVELPAIKVIVAPDNTITPKSGSIGGVVWLDENEDGVWDDGESSVEGFAVSLYVEDDTENAAATAVTGADGSYTFIGLESGLYVLGIQAQSIDGREYLLPLTGITGDNRFAIAGDWVNAYTEAIEIQAGSDNESINAGVRTPPVIQPLIGGTWSGTGAAGDPYLIADAADLAQLATNANNGTDYFGMYFKMTADIDLSGYQSGGGWTPIGKSGALFRGTFDGSGYVVSNLKVDSTTQHVGLFGYISGNDVIKNLGVYGNVRSTNSNASVGILVGILSSGTIANCHSSGSATGINGSSSGVGGLIGNNIGTITNCYTTGNVSNGYNIGGLAGWNGGTIANCYALGSVTNGDYIGGFVGFNTSTVTNSYWNTASASKGLGYDTDTCTGKTVAEMKTADFADLLNTNKNDSGMRWYQNNGINGGFPYTVAFGGGDGSGAAHSYEISTPELLALLSDNVNSGTDYSGKYIKMTADIDLTGYQSGAGWTPIGKSGALFQGTFDGCGNVVSNLKVNSGTQFVGLFGYTGSSGTIKNLGVADANVNGTNSYAYAGVLAGENNGPVINCYAAGSVSVSGSNISAGGLVGVIYESSVSNSYASCSVSSLNNANFGGLAGYNNAGTVTNCYWNVDAEQKVNGAPRNDNEKKGIGQGSAGADTTTAKAAAEMKTAVFAELLNAYARSNFLEYDWAVSAGVNDGFPYLVTPAPSAPPTVVTTTADSGVGSLRQAIADAAAGDTITFYPVVFTGGQSITLTSRLEIDKSLTIEGPAAGVELKVNGDFRHLASGARDTTVTLRNLTFTGRKTSLADTSKPGGGISSNNNTATLNLENCTIKDCHNPTGGGMAFYGMGSITNCTIVNNSAGNGGGALVNNPQLTFINCTIVGNSAAGSGGGVYVNGVPLVIYGSIVAGNTGGNVHQGSTPWPDAAPTAANNYNIIGEPAGYSLLEVFGTATPALANNGGPTQTVLIGENSPAKNGILTAETWIPATDQRGYTRPYRTHADIGAVELQGPVVTTTADSGAGSLRQAIADAVADDIVTFDSAVYTGGQTITLNSVLDIGKSLTIEGPAAGVELKVSGNFRHVTSSTGSITFTLKNLTFTGRKTSPADTVNLGGGIGTNITNITSNIENCTIRNCHEQYDGGGIELYGRGSITNCTIVNNSAGADGGGASVDTAPSTFVNCTIVGNSAGSRGGGVWRNGTAPVIYGSIVAGNTGGNVGNVSNPSWTDAEPSAANNYSIIGEPLGYSLAEVFGTALPALGDNGGPTQTILIKDGGSACDVIPNTEAWLPTTDQRGLTRPYGTHADIGAVEIEPLPIPTVWNALTANGTANTTDTTELTLTFDTDPATLATGNISVAGATKGVLSGSGTTRTLAISNITVAEGQNVTVTLTNPAGYNITPLSKSAAVHRAAAGSAQHTITASAGTGGSISPSGSVTVSDGGSQTFTITASSGYSISSVTADGASIGAVGSYTFSNVTGNHTIHATFSGGGGGSVGGGGGSGGSYVPSQPSHSFSGGVNKYTQGSGTPLIHVIQKDFSRFGSVRVDNGTLIRDKQYGAESGSTKITLYPGYLDTLAVGKHTLSVLFTDGVVVTAEFTVVEGEIAELTPEPWVSPFVDVNEGAWYYEDVEYVYTHALFSGTSDTTFSPDMPMTRAMFAQVLAKLDDADLSGYGTSRFSDVPVGAWYASAVEWAADNGIVSGVGDGLFNPETSVTREQMAVMLDKYFQYEGFSLPAGSSATFDDENRISGWALGSVKTIQAAGIVNGKPGNRFDPSGTATRAEVATIFARLAEYSAGGAAQGTVAQTGFFSECGKRI